MPNSPVSPKYNKAGPNKCWTGYNVSVKKNSSQLITMSPVCKEELYI